MRASSRFYFLRRVMAAEGAGQLLSVVTLLGAAIITVPIFKKIGLVRS